MTIVTPVWPRVGRVLPTQAGVCAVAGAVEGALPSVARQAYGFTHNLPHPLRLNPLYYAVIFTSQRTAVDTGCGDTAERMVELAAQQPWFLVLERAHSRNAAGLCGLPGGLSWVLLPQVAKASGVLRANERDRWRNRKGID